jgi:hypothetical protein
MGRDRARALIRASGEQALDLRGHGSLQARVGALSLGAGSLSAGGADVLVREALLLGAVECSGLDERPLALEALPRAAEPDHDVVVSPIKRWSCAACGEEGDLLKMEDAGPLCLTCADLDHLVYLPHEILGVPPARRGHAEDSLARCGGGHRRGAVSGRRPS